MENQLIAKKVHETFNQRFYKLNKVLKKFPNPNFDYDEEFSYQINKIKKENKGIIDHIKDGTDIICISDAHTHIERLCFPGFIFELDGKKDYGRFSFPCDGKLTFMIHGGNSRDVHPDEVYLRRIASVNNLTLLIEK